MSLGVFSIGAFKGFASIILDEEICQIFKVLFHKFTTQCFLTANNNNN